MVTTPAGAYYPYGTLDSFGAVLRARLIWELKCPKPFVGRNHLIHLLRSMCTSYYSYFSFKHCMVHALSRFSVSGTVWLVGICRLGILPVRTIRYGRVRYCTVRYGMLRYGTVRSGTVRHGKVRHSLVRYSTVRYGTAVHVVQFLAPPLVMRLRAFRYFTLSCSELACTFLTRVWDYSWCLPQRFVYGIVKS